MTATPAENNAQQALKGLRNLLTGRARPLVVVLDPGHGGTDPGAVGNGTTEALQVAEFVATAAFFLRQIPGVVVRVSRGANYPTWAQRTFGLGRADVAIAVHMDSAKGGRTMAYYAAGRDHANGPSPLASMRFANILNDVCPDPEFVVLPDSESRFKRLYIRGFLAPVSVLWELDPVHVLTRDERLTRTAQLLDALARGLRSGVIGV